VTVCLAPIIDCKRPHHMVCSATLVEHWAGAYLSITLRFITTRSPHMLQCKLGPCDFEFHKGKYFWVAEQLLPSQAQICSILFSFAVWLMCHCFNHLHLVKSTVISQYTSSWVYKRLVIQCAEISTCFSVCEPVFLLRAASSHGVIVLPSAWTVCFWVFLNAENIVASWSNVQRRNIIAAFHCSCSFVVIFVVCGVHFALIKSSAIPCIIQGVFKKRPNFCYKDFIAHFTTF
jgi:hypothetical protein